MADETKKALAAIEAKYAPVPASAHLDVLKRQNDKNKKMRIIAALKNTPELLTVISDKEQTAKVSKK
tara:strand:+ start:575 stop:775 length:201 start_codon:yes stop_codon:yes gene_type:complete